MKAKPHILNLFPKMNLFNILNDVSNGKNGRFERFKRSSLLRISS